MGVIRERAAVILEVAVFVLAVVVWLAWQLVWSWRYLIPRNLRALAAVRAAHAPTARRPSHYRLKRTTRDRCYVETVEPLAFRGSNFELWCYWYDGGRVERVAYLSRYGPGHWRVAVEEFEESGQCQDADQNLASTPGGPDQSHLPGGIA
jgi:hypothetical protein